jgi:cell division protein FtsB
MKREVLNKNRIKKKNVSLRIVGLILMLAFISFFTYHLILSVDVANNKLKWVEIAQEEVNELRLENLKLILEKSEIVSIDYLEKEARDRLRYSGEGEVLFVIPAEVLNSEQIEEELRLAKGLPKKVEYTDTKEILDVWIDFLFVSGV